MATRANVQPGFFIRCETLRNYFNGSIVEMEPMRRPCTHHQSHLLRWKPTHHSLACGGIFPDEYIDLDSEVEFCYR